MSLRYWAVTQNRQVSTTYGIMKKLKLYIEREGDVAFLYRP